MEQTREKKTSVIHTTGLNLLVCIPLCWQLLLVMTKMACPCRTAPLWTTDNRAITRKPVKHAKEKSPLNIHHLCFCFSAALCFQITGFSQCITQGGSLRACTWLYVAFSVIFPRAGLMQQKCFSSGSTLTKQQRWEQKLTNKTNTERLTLLHYTFKLVALRDAAVVSAHR